MKSMHSAYCSRLYFVVSDASVSEPFITSLGIMNGELLVGGVFEEVNGEQLRQLIKYIGPDSCLISEITINETGKYSIFPNPVSEILNINTREGHSELKIFDTLGQLLLTKNINTQSSINVSQLKAGIYLLSIESENEKVVKRFVKE